MKTRLKELLGKKKEGAVLAGVLVILLVSVSLISIAVTSSSVNRTQAVGTKNETEVYYFADGAIKIVEEAIISAAQTQAEHGVLDKAFRGALNYQVLENLGDVQVGEPVDKNIKYNRSANAYEIKLSKDDKTHSAEVTVVENVAAQSDKVLVEYEITSTGIKGGQSRTLVSTLTFDREFPRRFITDAAVASIAEANEYTNGGNININNNGLLYVTNDAPLLTTNKEAAKKIENCELNKIPGGCAYISHEELVLPEFTMPKIPSLSSGTFRKTFDLDKFFKENKTAKHIEKLNDSGVYEWNNFDDVSKLNKQQELILDIGDNDVVILVDKFNLMLKEDVKFLVRGNGTLTFHIKNDFALDIDDRAHFRTEQDEAHKLIIYYHGEKEGALKIKGAEFGASIMGNYRIDFDRGDDDPLDISGYFVSTGNKFFDFEKVIVNPDRPILIYAPNAKVALKETSFVGSIVAREFNSQKGPNYITYDPKAYTNSPFDLIVQGGEGEEIIIMRPNEKVRYTTSRTPAREK